MRRSRALDALSIALFSAAASCATDVDPRCYETALSELRVCSGSSTVEGIDVSYYQGAVDWPAVKRAGKVFAIARVSDGTRVRDTQFARNWRNMKAAGLVRGVYQFFRPAQDPTEQANLLIEQVRAAGGFEASDLPPVIDVESQDGVSAATLQARMHTWLQRVEAATGQRPIIYTANFMSSLVGNGFTAYPLWVANYGATCPLMPSNWAQWKFWQYSSTGRVAGISGNVDVNKWNGTLAQLQAFAGTAPADAGVARPDAGVARPDAGIARDGGLAVDAGIARDAGLARDAGVTPDAGVARDAGITQDAGVAADAGMESDAGIEEPDAGANEPDAGSVPGTDGGSPPGTMGSGQGGSSGEGCR